MYNVHYIVLFTRAGCQGQSVVVRRRGIWYLIITTTGLTATTSFINRQGFCEEKIICNVPTATERLIEYASSLRQPDGIYSILILLYLGRESPLSFVTKYEFYSIKFLTRYNRYCRSITSVPMVFVLFRVNSFSFYS